MGSISRASCGSGFHLAKDVVGGVVVTALTTTDILLTITGRTRTNTALSTIRGGNFIRYKVDSKLPKFSCTSTSNGFSNVSISIYHNITTTMFNSSAGIGCAPLATGRHFATLRSKRISLLSHGAA